MNTSRLHRFTLNTLVAVLAIVAPVAQATDDTAGIPPIVPVISIRATVPETREPFCDPVICDAAPPPPGVLIISRRGGNLASSLSVSLSYEGTASNGLDYATLPNFVTFRAGSATVELFVEGTYDRLPEGDEIVIARLQPDPTMGPIERYRLDPLQTAARVFLHDNETPVVPVLSIEATSSIAEETSYPYRRLAFRGRFTISRTGPTDNAQSVFVHYSGTAKSGEDYPALPWLVSIPAGADRVELDVVPVPDGVAEPIEILEAQLSSCPPLTDPPLGMPCHLVEIDPARASARVFLRDDGITTASLELTAPKDGAEFGAGQPIRIAATAIDLEGAITHVEFFDADTKIGESVLYFIRQPDPGTPIYHEFEWTGATVGKHELTVRAVNAAGLKIVSSPIQLNVIDGLPIVSIEATVPETTEPSPTTRIRPSAFTLRRTGDATATLRVWVNYAGTATPGSDYAELPHIVEFPIGAATVELLVGPIDDDVNESDETVIAELGPSPLATVPNYRIDPVNNRARVVIHDSDLPVELPVIAFDGSAFEATEPTTAGAHVPLVPILRTGAAPDLVLHFEISGTATEGVDYIEITREQLYPSAASGIGLYVIVLPDLIRENDETLIIKLVQPSGGNPGYQIDPLHDTAVITIHDSPPLPVPVVKIAATRPETTEPFDCRTEPCPLGPIAAPGVLTISRSAPLDHPLDVYVGYQGTARAGEDYFALPGVVTIPAGQDSVDLQVTAVGDAFVEGDETVEAMLLPDSRFILSPHYLVDPAHASARVTVHDNTPPSIPVVSIRATQPTTSEPCPVCRFAPGVFTISRTGSTSDSLHVLYRLSGTAKNGEDYERLTGQAIIPAGRESVEVLVIGKVDNAPEGNETVVAQLYVPEFVIAIYPPPPPPYSIDPEHGAATVTIRDYPFTPSAVVSIVATDPFAREGESTGGEVNTSTFTVTRSGDTNTLLAVHFTLSGTALPGVDYAPVASPLIIPAGERRARLVIKPVDDLRTEPIETVIVTLAGDDATLESYTLGFPHRAAAIIVDNDRLRPTCVRLPDGLFNLCLPVESTDCFRVEITRDFKEWTPLCTVPANEGRAHFVDPDAPDNARRFYRLVPVPCDP